MHETAADLEALQRLLDASYAAAGPHLLGIHEPQRRLSAAGVAERLQGMCLLTLATTTADGRPIAGPVDGVLHHGALHFSTAPEAVRWRHIRRRPQVSAVHLPGEHLAVTVHGTAVPVPVRGPEGAELRRTLLEVYVPRYGPEWETFLDSPPPTPVFARIDAARMFAYAAPE